MDGKSSSSERTAKKSINLILLFTIILPVTINIVLLSYLLALGYMHDADPDQYRDYIRNTFGITNVTWYTLPEDAEAKLIELGFDPMIVTFELKANEWINSSGGEIDIGMQLSILEFESGGGSNIGNCDGLNSAASFSQQEYSSALWLLNYWENHNIRDWSETAEFAVDSNYSNYIGHCCAGEIGPNAILPSTGVNICQNGLSTHDDIMVRSCNFFDYRVAPYAKVWWLKAIGYKSSQSYEEKMLSLFGWNQSEEYRNMYITRADEINQSLADFDFEPVQDEYYVFSGNWVKKIVLKGLQLVGLLPENVYAQPSPIIVIPPVEGEFANPHPDGFICGYGYGQPVGNGIHWGIDVCSNGISQPIYAAHAGEVKFARYLPQSEYLAYLWWISGNTIVIEGEDEDGNEIWTAYGHGAEGTIGVQVGDTVQAGQLIMMSGSTGWSTETHLHFGMKINGSWVNPTEYIVIGGN